MTTRVWCDGKMKLTATCYGTTGGDRYDCQKCGSYTVTTPAATAPECPAFTLAPAPVSPPSGSAPDATAGAGIDHEGAPAPCASASQPQVQGTRDAEGAPGAGLRIALAQLVAAVDALGVYPVDGSWPSEEARAVGFAMGYARAALRFSPEGRPDARELAVDPASGTRAEGE